MASIKSITLTGDSLNEVSLKIANSYASLKKIPIMLARLAMTLVFVVVAAPAQVIPVAPAGKIKTLADDAKDLLHSSSWREHGASSDNHSGTGTARPLGAEAGSR